MKESLFKKGRDRIRADAHFTKNEDTVSSFSDNYDEEKLLSHVMSELGALFSELKTGGFSKEELDITLSQRDTGFAICIKPQGRDLAINEVNLICRLAIQHGLSPRTVDGGVEILSSLPMLEASSIYAKVVTLLKERIDSTFSNETN